MFHLELFQRLLKRGENETGEPFSAKMKRRDKSEVPMPQTIMKTSLFASAKIMSFLTYQNVWHLKSAFHVRNPISHHVRSQEAPVNIPSF